MRDDAFDGQPAVDPMHDTVELPAVPAAAQRLPELPEPVYWIGQDTINPGDTFDRSAARAVMEEFRDNDRRTARTIGKAAVTGLVAVGLAVGGAAYITSGHSNEPQPGHIIEQTDVPVPPSPSIAFEMPAPADTEEVTSVPQPVEKPTHQPETSANEPSVTEEPEQPESDDEDKRVDGIIQEPLTPDTENPDDQNQENVGKIGDGNEPQQNQDDQEQDDKQSENPDDQEHEDEQEQQEEHAGQSDDKPDGSNRVAADESTTQQ